MDKKTPRSRILLSKNENTVPSVEKVLYAPRHMAFLRLDDWLEFGSTSNHHLVSKKRHCAHGA
jgi:hypothetical protein